MTVPALPTDRIVTGRGGYCFHFNGAVAALLASLGYRITPVRSAVPAGDGSSWVSHLVLSSTPTTPHGWPTWASPTSRASASPSSTHLAGTRRGSVSTPPTRAWDQAGRP